MPEEKAAADASGKTHEEASENSNVTQEDLQRLKAELLENLEAERKASAGKDKKITELQGQIKDYQKQTLSKDQLLELQKKEFEDQKAEFDKQQAVIKAENERERRENIVNKVIGRYADKYPGLIRFADRIHGNTEEEIEVDIKKFAKDWVGDQTKRLNVAMVTGKPQSGNGKQLNYTAEEVRAMPPKQKMEWAKTAPKEEYDAIFDELHSE